MEEGAAECGYCGLTDPLKGLAPAESAVAPYRRPAIALGVLVLLGAAGGAVFMKRGAPPMPGCGDPKYVAAVAEIVHGNAVYELSPEVARRFPLPVFATFSRIEPTEEKSSVRRCAAVLLLALDDPATALVERLVRAPAGVPEPTRALMATSWHAAERRLELPVRYSITASSDAEAPWNLALDEAAVAGIRDAIGVIARSAK